MSVFRGEGTTGGRLESCPQGGRCVIVVGVIAGKGRASKGDWDRLGEVGGRSEDVSHAKESEWSGTARMSTWTRAHTLFVALRNRIVCAGAGIWLG